MRIITITLSLFIVASLFLSGCNNNSGNSNLPSGAVKIQTEALDTMIKSSDAIIRISTKTSEESKSILKGNASDFADLSKIGYVFSFDENVILFLKKGGVDEAVATSSDTPSNVVVETTKPENSFSPLGTNGEGVFKSKDGVNFVNEKKLSFTLSDLKSKLGK